MTTNYKVLTVRLPEAEASMLETVARLRRVSVAEEVREAVTARVQQTLTADEQEAIRDQLRAEEALRGALMARLEGRNNG
jgi:hypothetical protein